MTATKRGALWLRLAVAAGALGLALTLVEPAAWQLAARHPQWLLPPVLGWLANQGLCALRFAVLVNCAGVSLPLASALRMQLAGNLVGSIFGGFASNDATRLVWLRQTAGARFSAILSLIVVDRVLGLCGYAVWAFALSYVVDPPDAAGAAAVVDAVRILCVVLGVATIALVLVATTLSKRHHAGTGLLDRIARIAGVAGESRVALGLVAAFPLAVLSAGSVIVAQGILGTHVTEAFGSASPFVLQAFLAPASIVISILPLVPLGVGLGQLTMSGLFALFGLEVEGAVILTTAMQLGQFAVAVACGAPVLAMLRRATAVEPPRE